MRRKTVMKMMTKTVRTVKRKKLKKQRRRKLRRIAMNRMYRINILYTSFEDSRPTKRLLSPQKARRENYVIH